MAKKEKQWVTRSDVLDLNKTQQKMFFQGVEQEQAPNFREWFIATSITVALLVTAVLVIIAVSGE